eukprot:TRINITY_DN4895_c0_g1_i1.p2 TRINITY_DN4895_c0_g1~~TRINITY_DN4895_c0_g1_i1.p2  ORF type:complete len:108 (-),score=3.05 TRINITY_DN4895_c0_g1_i1:208-531(-)
MKTEEKKNDETVFGTLRHALARITTMRLLTQARAAAPLTASYAAVALANGHLSSHRPLSLHVVDMASLPPTSRSPYSPFSSAIFRLTALSCSHIPGAQAFRSLETDA